MKRLEIKEFKPEESANLASRILECSNLDRHVSLVFEKDEDRKAFVDTNSGVDLGDIATVPDLVEAIKLAGDDYNPQGSAATYIESVVVHAENFHSIDYGHEILYHFCRDNYCFRKM